MSTEQKIEALWRRGPAYLATGKIREFQHDCDQLKELQASIATVIEENKNYAIFKLTPYMLRDAKCQDRFVNILMIRKEIQSEKDVTFTSSGLVFVKKLNKS